MARRDFFDHVTPDGRSPLDRMRQAGADCARLAGPDGRLAENLFRTTAYARFTYPSGDPSRRTYEWSTPGELGDVIVRGWLDSPGHRANLLRPGASLHGLGVAYGTDERLFVTHVFC
jgi:uncharacterized protein YkwD